MAYRLLRSARKTLALEIDRATGELTVRAPLRMPLAQIERFIAQKRAWVDGKQRDAAKREVNLPMLADGESLPFGGRTLTVRLSDISRPREENGELLLPRMLPPSKGLRLFLQAQAGELLAPLVRRWAGQTGYQPAHIRFSTARTRWGSMSANGGLRLNLALLLCPQELSEYVVVHELCHIPHPNHSAAFWTEVAYQLPDYRARRERLAGHAMLLTLLSATEV